MRFGFLFPAVFLGLLLPIFSLFGEEEEAEETPEEKQAREELLALPNFVLIIADDMAWDDCSPYGHDSILTPNLQRLADEGMRFDRAFVTASSCSPSRASILTGRYPHQTDAEQLHWPVPAGQITFVEKLREKGYWAGAAGKWHLGDAMRERFDEIREVNYGEAEGDERSGCAEWVPLLKDRPRDRPFLLWLAALDPHRPYESGIVPEPARPEEVRVPPYHPDTPAVRADYQAYYDEITRLDGFVGRVLDELEAQEEVENTVVLFISDNGRPFPRDKTTLYDSGIRTPFLLRWPAAVAPGSVCERLVSTVDIAKTFMRIGGIETLGQTFEGRDFSPLLADPEKPIRGYIFAEKNWHDFEDHARAVRNERYKYIRNSYIDLPLTPPADALRSATHAELLRLQKRDRLTPVQEVCFVTPRPAEELYDTKLDPHELNNLARDERFEPVLEAMRAALEDWERKTKDRVPEVRTSDEFDRTTGLPTEDRVTPRPSKAEMIKQGLIAP